MDDTNAEVNEQNAKVENPNAVPLSVPIQAHGKTVKELIFRRPNGKDLRLNGMPYTVVGRDGIKIDTASVSKMISELAGIPISSVDQLDPPDYNECLGKVMGFFGVATLQNSSTATTNSPGGGETTQPSSS